MVFELKCFPCYFVLCESSLLVLLDDIPLHKTYYNIWYQQDGATSQTSQTSHIVTEILKIVFADSLYHVLVSVPNTSYNSIGLNIELVED